MYWREIEPATKPTRRQTVTNARLANSCRDAERTMGQSWPEYPLAVQGSPQARSAQKTAPPPIAVEATAQRRVNFMLDRLTPKLSSRARAIADHELAGGDWQFIHGRSAR